MEISDLAAVDPRLAGRVVVAENGCWEFTGYISPAGYGGMGRMGRIWRVHRYVYELLVAPIPADFVIDHLCRVRHCCNPGHLEPVTLAENIHRGEAGQHTVRRPRTHCANGHTLDAENTRVEVYGGYPRRRCVTCKRGRDADRRR